MRSEGIQFLNVDQKSILIDSRAPVEHIEKCELERHELVGADPCDAGKVFLRL